MSNSKFWIWFIPLFLIVCVGIYFLLNKNYQKYEVNKTTDAIKIKEEYKKENENYYNVDLSNYNVYKYISDNDLKEMLDKKDGLVFVGDTTNNVSRKALVVLNDVVSSTSVKEVYYINKKDINEDLSNYFESKIGNSAISAGTLISVESGNILRVYYPSNILNNKELTDSEKDQLYKIYNEIVNKFIEECDENC